MSRKLQTWCRSVAALVASAVVSLPVQGGAFNNPAENWVEGAYALPEPIRAESLKAFEVSATTPNTFYVDERSISVGDDGVVRYALVVETSGGARNVTFEGIRCAGLAYRSYATAGPDLAWRPLRQSEWAAIVDNSYNRPRAALAQSYFCKGSDTPQRLERIVRSLKEPVRPAALLGPND